MAHDEHGIPLGSQELASVGREIVRHKIANVIPLLSEFGEGYEAMHVEDRRNRISDTIADLLHLACQEGFHDVLDDAIWHFLAEEDEATLTSNLVLRHPVIPARIQFEPPLSHIFRLSEDDEVRHRVWGPRKRERPRTPPQQKFQEDPCKECCRLRVGGGISRTAGRLSQDPSEREVSAGGNRDERAWGH